MFRGFQPVARPLFDGRGSESQSEIDWAGRYGAVRREKKHKEGKNA